MGRYKEWLLTQDELFIEELTNGEITDCFIDRNIRAISIEELKKLDTMYICDIPPPVEKK